MDGGLLTGGSVSSTQLGPGSVTTGKIQDGHVTAAKLDTSYATSDRVAHILEGTVSATTLSSTNLRLGDQGTFQWLGQIIRTYAVKETSGNTIQALGYKLS